MKNISLFKNNKGEDDQLKLLFKFSSMEDFSPKKGVIAGVAVPYGEQTQDYRKLAFRKGSFTNLNKVSAFVNHDSFDVAAMIGVVEFTDTPDALMFKMKLNLKDSFVTEKVIPLIEMGALEGVSVGAYILKKEDTYDDDSGDRISTDVTLSEVFELSIVTFQAFESAKIQANKEQEMHKKANDKSTPAIPAEVVTLEAEVETPVEPEVEAEPEAEVTEPEVEAEVEAEPEVELSVATMSNEQLIERLQAQDKKILELKQKETDKDKKLVVSELIKAGKLHKAQSDRVINKFDSADEIKEFYKDIPESFSVEPAGSDSADVTVGDVDQETCNRISSQSSVIEEGDIEKYNTIK